MTQPPKPERRGQAAAQFAPGMTVRLKTEPDQVLTVTEPSPDGWWDTLLIPGVPRWDQLLTESGGKSPIRRWRLVTDLEPVPAEPGKEVTPDATA